MAPLGTKKINKMLILDYVDGKPSNTFRAEIDIPLGGNKNFTTLKKLLDKKQTSKGDKAVVKLLLSKLGTLSASAPADEKARHKAARHFVAAAFDMEPGAK